jgi:NAD(P)H-hydrate epimerase
MKLVTVSEMLKIEKEANTSGLSYSEMMENAGRGLAEVVLDEFQALKNPSALGLVGSGNNGGDTLIALAILAKAGWKASAYIVKTRPTDDPLVSRLEKDGGIIYSIETDSEFRILSDLLGEHNILLDGVLGTGIKLPLRGKIAELLETTRSLLEGIEDPPEVVAVDCPSGVDSDSGEVAPECICADLTVTMAAVKSGLLKFPAYNTVGKLRLVGIGLVPDDKRSKTWRKIKTVVADPDTVRKVLPKRPLDAHKGTFGTALVVAGSVNYTGAAMLSGKAAYRIGAGLVTLAVPAPLHSVLAGHLPEATWILLPHELGVISADAARVLVENLERPTALLLGPGFGVEETTRDFLAALIGESSKKSSRSIGFVTPPTESERGGELVLPPMVIDADGFKLLKQIKDWKNKLPAPAVLTPHPGEMSFMTGLSTSEIQADRISVAEESAKKWGHVVVLKGAHTIVASPDGRMTIIPIATPALARAGTGDVLAGLIVGLIAQGVGAYESAVASCWIHAQAGLYAEALYGNSAPVLAGDVLDMVPEVLRELW